MHWTTWRRYNNPSHIGSRARHGPSSSPGSLVCARLSCPGVMTALGYLVLTLPYLPSALAGLNWAVYPRRNSAGSTPVGSGVMSFPSFGILSGGPSPSCPSSFSSTVFLPEVGALRSAALMLRSVIIRLPCPASSGAVLLAVSPMLPSPLLHKGLYHRAPGRRGKTTGNQSPTGHLKEVPGIVRKPTATHDLRCRPPARPD